jgi:hypothetical protein
VRAAISAVHRVAERNLAEVNRIPRSYFLQRDELEPISRVESRERMKNGLVTLLDVRPDDEFRLVICQARCTFRLPKPRSWLASPGKRWRSLPTVADPIA